MHSLVSKLNIKIDKWWKYLLLSFVTTFSFCIKLDVASEKSTLENICNSFNSYGNVIFLAFPILFIFYRYIEDTVSEEIRLNKRLSIFIPSVLFSLFMVFGYSFEKTDSWSLVMSLKNGQALKALIVIIGYTIFFYYIVTFVYAFFDRVSEKHLRFNVSGIKKIRPINWYVNKLKTHPFLTAFITLFVLYIPVIIISYPAKLMLDTVWQIGVAYKNVITAHQPVLHTMFLYIFIDLGKNIFNDANVGLFISALVQFVLFLVSISFSIHVLVKKIHISIRYIVMLLLFYLFLPIIREYAFFMVKEVLYSAFLILFLTFLFCIYKKQTSKLIYIGFAVSAIGVLLFRNEGKYILIFAFIVMIIWCKGFRFFFTACLVGVVSCSLIYSAILNTAGVISGSKREMLSVPFQQTARYIRDCGKEVTEEEKEAIDKVLDYNSMAENYESGSSDPVKGTFKESSTTDDLKNYFVVWAKMFVKHPEVYIQATMNNYYQYFYPYVVSMEYTYKESEKDMQLVPAETLWKYGVELSYPQEFSFFRECADSMNRDVKKIPIFSVLSTPAFYAWAVILLCFYAIKMRKGKAFAILLVPIGVLIFCCLSPVNGFLGRYSYPLMMCMPIVAPMVLSLCKGKKSQKTLDNHNIDSI